MRTSLVSVILAAYNQVGFIDEAIRSAVEQDYDPLEVIVGDDGSTDGTREKILDWAARYPGRVIAVDGPHLGVTGNCNRILAAARGKYYTLHAGDDLYLPGKIRKQVEWMEGDSDRVLCSHAVELFDSATGARVAPIARQPRNGSGAGDVVATVGFFPGVSVMLRAGALPSYGYDERAGIVSDWKLLCDVLAAGGTFGYIDEVLARRRLHENSLSQRYILEDTVARDGLQGFLASLGVMEAEYPHLIPSCRRARAKFFFMEARRRQGRAQTVVARSYFWGAVREDWTMLPKSLAGIVLSLLPRDVQVDFERVLRKIR